MNRFFKILLLSVVFAFLCAPGRAPLSGISQNPLYAQEETGITDETAAGEKSDAPALIKEEAAKKGQIEAQPPVQKPRIAADVNIPAPKKESMEAYAGDGLLDITEGAFKYRRIPGIKIAESPVATVPPAETLHDDKAVEEKDDKDGEAGLFGLSRSATDTLARVVLFGIIILIFVLYRVRARSRRSSVLKRFPKL